MAPAGRRRETGKINSTTERKRKMICKKRPLLQAGGNQHPVGFLFSKFMTFFSLREILLLRRRKSTKEKGQKLDLINKTSLIKEPGKRQPILKLGMISFNIMAYWRAPDLDVCYVCGEDDHLEQFCPYNYIYGLYDQETCRAHCFPGQHTITSIARRKFLQCFIRVNNMPPSFRSWDLGRLFKPFGPLLMWDVPLVRPNPLDSSNACRGFGVVIFKKREDGERAINELNGYNADNHKLRVDWAYPCA